MILTAFYYGKDPVELFNQKKPAQVMGLALSEKGGSCAVNNDEFDLQHYLFSERSFFTRDLIANVIWDRASL